MWQKVDEITARCQRCGKATARLGVIHDDVEGDVTAALTEALSKLTAADWDASERRCRCEGVAEPPAPAELVADLARLTRGGRRASFTIRV